MKVSKQVIARENTLLLEDLLRDAQDLDQVLDDLNLTMNDVRTVSKRFLHHGRRYTGQELLDF